MVYISEISFKNRKNCTYLYDLDHEKTTTITTGYLKKNCKSWRYEVFETEQEEISQVELLKCLLFCFSAQQNICKSPQCAQPFTFLDEVELQKHLNTCPGKVITRTLEHFLNIFDMFCRVFLRRRFRFFIQLRSQKDARVM